MLHQRQILLGTILGALLLTVATESVQAQPGGNRGRGGILAIDSVRDELKISDELYEKIREATGGSSFSPEMFSLASKIRSASEAEKPALRAQVKKLQQDNAKKAQDKLKALISPAQFTRMQQLTLQRNGTRALMDPTLAGELKVDDDQREKIKAIVEEMEEKRQSNRDSNASDEERRAAAKKNSAERDKRVLALLNPEQTKAWEAKLGPAAPEGVFDGRPRNTAAPVVQNSNSGAAATTPAPANLGSIPLNPDGSEKPRDVVASFGVDPKKDIAKKEASVLAFNFKYAPWADVLKLFADSCGYELDIINVPPGTWDLQSSKTYTPRQALNLLNGALLQKGYIIVKRDEFLVVLSLDGGPVPPNIVPRVALEEIHNLGANELVTVIMPLSPSVVDLQAAADAIKQQVGPQGSVVALTGTNRLQITDLASVLIGIEKAWSGTDLPDGEVIFKSFKLVNVPVTDAEEIVRNLFGLPERGITNVSQSATGGSSRSSSQQSRFSGFSFGGRSFGGSSRGQDPRSSRTTSSRGSTSSRSTAANSVNGTMSVAADVRNNLLLVKSPTKQMAIIEATIEAIDVKGDDDLTFYKYSEPYLEVYKVNTDAVEVAKTLGVLYPPNIINEDGRNGLIHILATAEEHRKIAIDIQRLDGQISQTEIAIISLDRMNAYTAMSTIQSLFFNEPNAPTVQSMPDGRGLLIRGSKTHVDQIKTVLDQMKTHLATYQNQGGTTRIQALQGIDPYDMIEMLKAGWGDDGPNPIRVITPRNSSPIRNQLVPSATTPVRAREAERSTGIPRERPQTTPTPVRGTDASASIDANIRGRVRVSRINDRNLFISGNSGPTPSRNKNGQANFSVPVGNQTDAKADATDAKVNATASQSDEPVTTANDKNGIETVARQRGATVIVSPNGPDLLLICKDEKVLDEMQAMISSLASRMPVKPQWTVFYLSSSDATETATMLGRLLPSSSVTAVDSGGGGGLFAGLTSSLSGMGRGLMDATGLSNLGTGPMTLQIIPEVRSNALYVSGPPHQVREVGEYLKVLDASELPSQLRQRSPKMIPVMYADVNEIADIVRSVYKEEIEGVTSPGGGGGGVNLAAMFMGGGGGGRSSRGGSGGGRAQKQIKLTLGIDSNTNQLIISSSDSLFREIDSLVYRLDEDARRANPTVTLVSLKSANARQVENALKSLMPGKINVTRSANTSSNSRSSSGGTSSQSGARSPEQVRQFMEMRQRMLQGGGGRGGQPTSTGRGGFDRGSSGRGGTTGRGGFGGRGGTGGRR